MPDAQPLLSLSTSSQSTQSVSTIKLFIQPQQIPQTDYSMSQLQRTIMLRDHK
jgi:hypothetical protein